MRTLLKTTAWLLAALSGAAGSPAAQSGLLSDDRIIEVNRQRVNTLTELRAAAKDQATLLVRLRRGSQVLLIPLR